MANNDNVIYHVPMYAEHTQPDGFLPHDVHAVALWHYCMTVKANIKSRDAEVALEGKRNAEPNYHNVFKGVAEIYGVDPNDMEPFWPAVDAEMARCGFTPLPKDRKYRG